MAHYLIVEDLGDGEFDRSIEHEEDCLKLLQKQNDYDYPCKIGRYISWVGFEDIIKEPEYTTPGKYEIELYENYSDSWFTDSEVWLEIIRNNVTNKV